MAKKSSEKAVQYYGTGRRKSSVARVYLTSGKGKILVNGRDVAEYFPHDTFVIDVKQPLTLTSTGETVDIKAFVKGGGYAGQAGALRLGIARALMELKLFDFRLLSLLFVFSTFINKEFLMNLTT